MADLKITDLPSANIVLDNDVFYLVQNGISKKLTAKNLFTNINDPTFNGNIFLTGQKQVLTQSNIYIYPISTAKLRTEFRIGNQILYPTLPPGIKEGQLKILSMVDTSGGQVIIDKANSSIYGDNELYFTRDGDTALMLYTQNAWSILGTSPGFKSNISGFTDDIVEAPGTENRYFTNARSRIAISAGDLTIIYDQATGTIRANVAYLANLDLSTFTTDDLPQGNSNLYYNSDRAIADNEPARANLLAKVLHPVANVIYVKSNGNDLLDGLTLANAVANVHVALQRANAWTTVRVSSGEYTLWGNPRTIKRRVGLVGDNLRTTTIRGQYVDQDYFYVENGAYSTGFTFRDHVAPAAVFSFNPDGSAGIITTSPYIQNSSSITTTGTGMRVDGSFVGGLRSMVCDAYTQTNAGGIGIHMLNKGYTQLVSVFTICCQIAILCESGGFCSITNSNSSFGTFGLYCDGVSFPLYYGKVLAQINSRTLRMGNLSTRPSVGDAVLIANYDQEKCSRDTGLIVDSIAFDYAYSGNSQSTFAGLQYYKQSESAIPGQATETIAALNYAKLLATNVALNVTITTPYQATVPQVSSTAADAATANIIETEFNLITSIITNGTIGITDAIVPNQYPANTALVIRNASNAIINNKAFIAADTVAFVNNTYPTFSYDSNTCARDVGYIIDSIAFDLRHGGNKQAIQSGVYYYNHNENSSQIVNQQVQTTAAYDFIKSLTTDIVTGTAIVNPLQTAVSQNTTAATAATADDAQLINDKISIITTIIDAGPDAAEARSPIGLTANVTTNAVNATKLLLANKNFIKAEVLAYTNLNWSNISNGSVQFYTVATSTPLANVIGGYNEEKCARDTGYIVEGVMSDIVTGSNYRSTMSGLAYLRSYSSNVLTSQKAATIAAIEKARDLSLTYTTNAIIEAKITERFANVTNIINTGLAAVGASVYPNPTNIDSGVANAKVILQTNKAFVQDEITSWINTNEPTIAAIYDQALCRRDVGYVIDALTYDLVYGGTSQTTDAANAYYIGAVSTLPLSQRAPTGNAYTRMRDVIASVVRNTAIVRSSGANVSLSQNTASSIGSVASANTLSNLANIIIDFVPDGVYNNTYTLSGVQLTRPPYDANTVGSYTEVINNIQTIKDTVISYINLTFPNLGGIGESTVVLEEKILTQDSPRANSTVSFHQRSYISASGHTFEYVGSGNELAFALPSAGGIPVTENEVVELRGGAVYYTSTDHKGDFRIGNELLINRATGTINGRTFNKSLFAVMTPYILAIQ